MASNLHVEPLLGPITNQLLAVPNKTAEEENKNLFQTKFRRNWIKLLKQIEDSRYPAILYITIIKLNCTS